ncbi:hypothetical protein E4P41_04330 [Geodermatophilus sp. DF01-2]|uniref:hypothetical protein n=1 Tax=Geodermatophilus sp. DF01-2 TaxID=2559610 RepID=UPI001073514E|nr:hypothetical protein [Geodermatophilus sp. DF01_2]TFV63489.1 hypothetical protein E4P41_04330 [Geodermatophilus sp. DF01_2]
MLAGWVPAPAASACSCAGGTTAEYATRADAVFSGRLVSREVVGETALHVFVVETVHEGEVAARQGVVPAASGATCGLEVAGQGPFLVFATRDDDRLAAGLCGGTATWTPEVAAQLQELTGATAAPRSGAAGTELPGGPSAGALAVGAAVLLAAAVGGELLLRRRRPLR